MLPTKAELTARIAEIVSQRSDPDARNMGLTSWSGTVVSPTQESQPGQPKPNAAKISDAHD